MFDHLARQNINIPFGYDYFGQKVVRPGNLDQLANPNDNQCWRMDTLDTI
jgi:hypothetical protein